MSHWNYRAFQTQYSVKFIRQKEPHLEQVFTIREAYYDDEGKITMISASDCGISPKGDSYEELQEDIAKMQGALLKPTITPKNVPGYIYSSDEVPYNESP